MSSTTFQPAQFPVFSAPPRVQALTRPQRRAVVGLLLLAHGLLGWGLLQARLERREEAPPPLFVDIVTRSEPAAPPSLPQPRAMPDFRPELLQIQMPEVVVAAAPAPVTVTPAVPQEQPSAPSPATPVTVANAAPAERVLPASAVQYLEPPLLVYPRASRRAGEAGRVLLRVFIDEQGLPRQVQVNRSSGFARLDEAAIEALRKARFKPCIADGQPVAGWALVPLTFELNA